MNTHFFFLVVRTIHWTEPLFMGYV